MTEETEDDDEASDAYDPVAPTPPAREPPRRSTAPQSDYTSGQVAFGFVVLAIGAALVFGLPLVMG